MRETPNILIAYNCSPCSDAALNDLRHAGLPAVVHALVLTVADIILLPSGDEGGEGGMPAIRIPVVERHAREKAEEAIKEARVCAERGAKRVKADFPGWEVKAEVECDFPAWAVIKMADRLGSDLGVVGGHRRSVARGRFILGSTSQRVLYEAPCSLRVARFSEDRRARPIRIVVGFDGLRHARAAVAAVASRAWPAGSGVRLVTVGRESGRNSRVAAVERLRAAGLDVSESGGPGDPARVPVREAEEWGADSIFVGTRGLRRSQRLLHGSVVSAVAARAQCSVEVARVAAGAGLNAD